MDTNNWRGQLGPETRRLIRIKILKKLKAGHRFDDGELLELQKIAQSVEQKSYAGATSQSDYLEKNASKMFLLEKAREREWKNQQDELYQKIKTMKENYFSDLNKMHQKISAKLQQSDSLCQQPKTDQIEKLKIFKMMLEHLITFLEVSRSKISRDYKGKVGLYEKQIINFINTYRPSRVMPSLRSGQLPLSHIHFMSQPQPQSQVTQVQSLENQMNSQLQTTNMQGSGSTMQQDNTTSMQHSCMSGVSTTQQNMMNSMQPGTNLDSGQGNAINSLQQVPVGSHQQNPVSAPQQSNINSLSSQGGVNVIQSNLGLTPQFAWRHGSPWQKWPNEGSEPSMDNGDWRGQLQPESRQRIVNKIMDTLKRQLPVSGQERLHELGKIAQRFEGEIFTAATSQSDYIQKISLKMLTMETKSQGTLVNNLPSNQVGPSNKPPDPC